MTNADPLPFAPLAKTPSGIRGLDAITEGGLPAGRPTLVCGGAGCGKTLLAMEFLVRGAIDHGEPGVFMAFEESPRELATNVASLGFDLATLVAEKKLALRHVQVDAGQFDQTGDYGLEGLFIRLGHAIDEVGARRVVLDTIENLFASTLDESILRTELRRLFGWLKAKGVTAVITGERGEQTVTRFGIEEYVSDCVILLDHRMVQQVSTRRLRILKYRGSAHGSNEYPFLIERDGITVMPITALGLNHEASSERVSSGIPDIDRMLGGEGYFRGSSVLISGTAGSGKTSLAAEFAAAACARGERCLSFLFEESPSQLMRNMKSIGIDLQRWVDAGLLRFHSSRPSMHGLELHLASTLRQIEEFNPQVVVVDPISAFGTVGNHYEVKAMLVRMVDALKVRGVTMLMTSLTQAGAALEHTEQEISSLIDSWILLRDIESSGERNRGIYVLKSRGMAHSNQIREFTLTSHGVQLSEVYVGQGGVLTGAARLAQEVRDATEAQNVRREIERQELALKRKREALESRIAAMHAEFEAEEAEALRAIHQEQALELRLQQDRSKMRAQRGAEAIPTVHPKT